MANMESNDTNNAKINNDIIRIYAHEGTTVKIENENEVGKSIFTDIYKRALREINNIIINNKDVIMKSKHRDIYSNETNCYNNIVAFVGGRGFGKTSAMLTVASMLKDDKKYDKLIESGFNYGVDTKDEIKYR